MRAEQKEMQLSPQRACSIAASHEYRRARTRTRSIHGHVKEKKEVRTCARPMDWRSSAHEPGTRRLHASTTSTSFITVITHLFPRAPRHITIHAQSRATLGILKHITRRNPPYTDCALWRFLPCSARERAGRSPTAEGSSLDLALSPTLGPTPNHRYILPTKKKIPPASPNAAARQRAFGDAYAIFVGLVTRL